MERAFLDAVGKFYSLKGEAVAGLGVVIGIQALKMFLRPGARLGECPQDSGLSGS
jgi:hypothetical protein